MSDSEADNVDEVSTSTPELDRDLVVECALRGLAYASNRLYRRNLERESGDLVLRAIELILDEIYVPSEDITPIQFVLAVVKTLIAAEPEQRGLVHPRSTTLPSLAAFGHAAPAAA